MQEGASILAIQCKIAVMYLSNNIINPFIIFSNRSNDRSIMGVCFLYNLATWDLRQNYMRSRIRLDHP